MNDKLIGEELSRSVSRLKQVKQSRVKQQRWTVVRLAQNTTDVGWALLAFGALFLISGAYL